MHRPRLFACSAFPGVNKGPSLILCSPHVIYTNYLPSGWFWKELSIQKGKQPKVSALSHTSMELFCLSFIFVCFFSDPLAAASQQLFAVRIHRLINPSHPCGTHQVNFFRENQTAVAHVADTECVCVCVCVCGFANVSAKLMNVIRTAIASHTQKWSLLIKNLWFLECVRRGRVSRLARLRPRPPPCKKYVLFMADSEAQLSLRPFLSRLFRPRDEAWNEFCGQRPGQLDLDGANTMVGAGARILICFCY